MSTSVIRRIAFLAGFALVVWAIVIVPGLVAPRSTAALLDRALPAGPARLLRRALVPDEPAEAERPLVTVEEVLRPARQKDESDHPGVDAYRMIGQVITGEREAPPPQKNEPIARLLLTLIRAGGKGGGYAVLRVPGSIHATVAVAEGDVINIDPNTTATVTRVFARGVVLRYRGEQITIVHSDLDT